MDFKLQKISVKLNKTLKKCLKNTNFNHQPPMKPQKTKVKHFNEKSNQHYIVYTHFYALYFTQAKNRIFGLKNDNFDP